MNFQGKCGLLLLLGAALFFYSCSMSGSQSSAVQTNNVIVTNYIKYTNWTLLYYAAADDASLEIDILSDIRQMKLGMMADSGFNLIVLVDRCPGATIDSLTFGEDFTDTRLYRVLPGMVERLSGGDVFPGIGPGLTNELNLADAGVLADFVRFGKKYYPAAHYALILASHGDGPRGIRLDNVGALGFVVDESASNSGDRIFTAELSEKLGTNENVDLLGLDMCVLSSLEVAYQYRRDNGSFSPDYILASASAQYGGWQYRQVFGRIREETGDNGEADLTVGGMEKYYSAVTMTPLQLGGLFVEERRDFCQYYYEGQALALIDTAYAQSIKTNMDSFAGALASNMAACEDFMTNIRGTGSNISLLHYFNASIAEEWVLTPFFDAYRLFANVTNDSVYGTWLTQKAAEIRDAIDAMVVYSYGGYTNFSEGSNGVYIFFPDGTALYGGKRHWEYQWWYQPLDASTYGTGTGYGKLSWCKGAVMSNSIVENWFELLDNWYDTNNLPGMDINLYTY